MWNTSNPLKRDITDVKDKSVKCKMKIENRCVKLKIFIEDKGERNSLELKKPNNRVFEG